MWGWGATVEFCGGHGFIGSTGRFTDPEDIADHVASGGAVVLVGPLGTGKTETMHRVAHALAERDVASDLIRGLARVPTALAGSGGLPVAGAALLVDDAHDLDPDSASMLIEAVCRQRVPVCFAVEAPTVARASSDPVTGALLGLASKGFARRIDLEPLGDAEARSFVVESGAGDLDDMTIETIVWLANGSRALLKELAEVAREASADGRDPLVAVRDVPVWARLADTVHSHLAGLDADHLRTLVTVHRFPGLASAHAVRIRPQHEIDALRRGGYLHREESHTGSLWANPLLAQGAARILGAAQVDALVGSAVSRLLEGGGRWWSPPIATGLADLLLRGGALPAPAPAHLCQRALRDAARRNNDDGRWAAAEAYAAMGIAGAADDAGLQLELAHARVSAGEPSAGLRLPEILSDEEDRARALLLSATWGVRGYTSRAQELRSALERGASGPEDPHVTFALIDALGLSLEWPEARDAAHDAARATTGQWRLWCWLMEAYARGELADAEGAKRLLTRVDEDVIDGGTPGLTTTDRLWILMVELATHLVLGEDAPPIHERIARERRRAAREGNDRVLGIAGLAVALSAAVRGESDAAVRSLDAARARFAPLRQDMAVAGVKLWIAQFLASNGRTGEARAIAERVETVWSEGPLSLRHACAATRSIIDALDQRNDEAARALRGALAATTSRQSPMRRARDLYRGVALDVLGEEALLEIRRLLHDGRSPLTHALSHPPHRSPREGTVRSAFLGTLIARTPSSSDASAAASPRPGSAESSSLTRRECEIATLIAAGMSNRQIADHLFISVRTVESHIYQARGKVGAGSRRGLGEYFAGHAIGA